MNNESKSQSFLSTIKQTLESPLFSNDVRKELNALVSLMETFHVEKVTELSKPILALQKKLRTSVDGFVQRVKDYLTAQENGLPAPEPLEELVADFGKIKSADLKTIAKKLDVYLVDKNDAQLFENWLRDGVKPPTQDERFVQEVQTFVTNAVEIRDRTVNELSQASIELIVEIAKSVNKSYKIPGLTAFMRGLKIEPTGKTSTAIIKQLESFLKEIALYRIKVFERDLQ